MCLCLFCLPSLSLSVFLFSVLRFLKDQSMLTFSFFLSLSLPPLSSPLSLVHSSMTFNLMCTFSPIFRVCFLFSLFLGSHARFYDIRYIVIWCNLGYIFPYYSYFTVTCSIALFFSSPQLCFHLSSFPLFPLSQFHFRVAMLSFHYCILFLFPRSPQPLFR